MPNVEDYIPESLNFKSYPKLNEIWKDVYKKRRKKSGKKKAIYSANARVYAEMLKEFKINRLPKKNKIKLIKEKKEEWNDYSIDDNVVHISTEKRMLDDFPSAEKKGIVKDANDPFEQEILTKVMDEYDIKIHPQMYYVINGES